MFVILDVIKANFIYDMTIVENILRNCLINNVLDAKVVFPTLLLVLVVTIKEEVSSIKVVFNFFQANGNDVKDIGHVLSSPLPQTLF